MSSCVQEAKHITRRLSQRLAKLRFDEPVSHVYDPLVYAWRSQSKYLERFAAKRGRVILLGMNPGPWGMAQTGVPFGEVQAVRDWMGIEEPVDKPAHEHPKRPIEGFACARSEVSGRRLWGWAQERFGSAERFFAQFFVANYCPLIFLETSGRNRTPDKLSADERAELYAICDDALRSYVALLEPRLFIGIGAFAQARAKKVLGDEFPELEIGRILHPSPASPLANKGWAERAERELEALNVL